MSGNHEEEEDYMSDKVLSKVEDVRPGILFTKTAARKRKIEEEKIMADEAHRNVGQLRKHMEHKNRTEALATPVSTENKGFAMMAKMGYKPGMAIGKKGDGLKEPIGVELKSDRTGLGHASERKERAEIMAKVLKITAEVREKMHKHLKVDYQQRKRDIVAQKKLESDFWKSQKVCYELDSRDDIDSPAESYFWPSYTKESEDNDEEDGDKNEDVELEADLGIAEKLTILTAYLRECHCYCVWCGAKFDDETDLKDNCPGDTKEQHDDDDI